MHRPAKHAQRSRPDKQDCLASYASPSVSFSQFSFKVHFELPVNTTQDIHLIQSAVLQKIDIGGIIVVRTCSIHIYEIIKRGCLYVS